MRRPLAVPLALLVLAASLPADAAVAWGRAAAASASRASLVTGVPRLASTPVSAAFTPTRLSPVPLAAPLPSLDAAPRPAALADALAADAPARAAAAADAPKPVFAALAA
ncbi:MAG: hypothetical protein SF051_01160, partial [Elusimicrobiota bacterium]|nr:hypothetical protein [Elusimicrobiota bacterium]